MPSATQMIRQDHKKVEGLFRKVEQTKGAQAKRRLAESAMAELEIHAALEEEIFYPAVKKEVDDGSSMVQEAIQEHQTVKQLIAELKGMGEANDEFESQFSQLVENVQHHVEEEENEMLPKVEDGELDLNSLGAEMAQRRQELQNGGRATKKKASAKSNHKTAAAKSTGRKSTGKKSASSKTAARKTASSKKSTGRKATKKSGGGSRRRA